MVSLYRVNIGKCSHGAVGIICIFWDVPSAIGTIGRLTEKNIIDCENGDILIKKEVYKLPEKQLKYYEKHKLKTYTEVENGFWTEADTWQS